MKRYIFRPEHLLLLWLVLLPVVAFWYISDTALDIRLHDRYRLKPIYDRIYWMFVAGICISYIFHIILRENSLRNKIICNIQIWITIIITGSIMADFYLKIPLKIVMTELPPPYLGRVNK